MRMTRSLTERDVKDITDTKYFRHEILPLR